MPPLRMIETSKGRGEMEEPGRTVESSRMSNGVGGECCQVVSSVLLLVVVECSRK